MSKFLTKKRVKDGTERAGTKTRKKSRWRGEEGKEVSEDKQDIAEPTIGDTAIGYSIRSQRIISL